MASRIHATKLRTMPPAHFYVKCCHAVPKLETRQLCISCREKNKGRLAKTQIAKSRNKKREKEINEELLLSWNHAGTLLLHL
jgi:hypothetical protein